ncbi:MAG: gliding motility-associated C-terminal domain-containing protein [Bacteroidetes bacterium]|nr:gliding motility-associated C-terminal domain-containing protein [Bacteroidota bacterium]
MNTYQSYSFSETICQGETSFGYSSSGKYIDTLVSVSGCDSIRTLKLHVIPKQFETLHHQLCPGENLFSYTKPGTYIDTFLTSMGCDSLRILFLETDPLCCNIFVPNAFSPNGDDLNDEFIIRGIFQDYNLIIADRW